VAIKPSFSEPLSWLAWLTLLLIALPAGLIFLPGAGIVSMAIVAVSLWMMHRLCGVFDLTRITIPSFFYDLYVVSILVPGFFIFADEVTSSRLRFLIGIESVLITVPVGISIANLLWGFERRQVTGFFERAVPSEPLGRPAVTLFVVFLGFGALFVAINLVQMGTVPLFYLIRNPGEALIAAMLREDSFKLLNSHFTYIFGVLRGVIFPFLIVLAYGRYRRQGRRTWRWLFWITLLLGVFYASLTIEKSPVAAIFGLLFIFYYLYRGGRIGRIAAISSIVLFLCFPLMVVLLAYHGTQGGTLQGALQALGSRLFYSPAQIVYAYFEVFPAVIPFQHGASIAKIATILGWKTVDIPNAVGLYMTLGGDLDTITANSCFIGNLNADWGLPGVFVGGVVAGFAMQAVNIYLCRRPKTVVNIAAHAICMWAFGLLVTTALPTILLSGGVSIALILAWIFGRDSRDAVSPQTIPAHAQP